MEKARENVPSWNEFFIQIAETVSLKSKDPSTQNGCVIVDKKNKPISFGYNGFISDADENKMTFERPMKYFLTIHAEMNAILFAKRDLEDCTLYTLYAPCENCLKHIAQSGIKKIIYKNYIVESKKTNNEKYIANENTREAITRILLSRPDIQCYNINGKNFLEEMWGQDIPKF